MMADMRLPPAAGAPEGGSGRAPAVELLPLRGRGTTPSFPARTPGFPAPGRIEPGAPRRVASRPLRAPQSRPLLSTRAARERVPPNQHLQLPSRAP